MQTGLLWFDGDPGRELIAKIEDAARRYRDRFGVPPNTCYVNAASLTQSEPGLQFRVLGDKPVRVLPAANILLNHFWIGVEEKAEEVGA